jgi:hypothetical protein
MQREESGYVTQGDSGAPQWLSAQLLAMVGVSFLVKLYARLVYIFYPDSSAT